ncbi:ferrichrome ABC transporter ATP-binding protein [Halarchaeum acidiphilum MH1-52-1]|uniref:Cobalamin import ATP-binding protein BtuD n=1 Tax=Halarchaeum acidiphilum MH1-52-1 TaxID=1261545 RepID=U2YRF3_9EURY|nr:ABC transporter ATP-binding protein [Halarchaeum acidiphilum]GAD51297.1 ferrichrome ABC transporter ATP-binding protein [Halarchaeum acidiphilum MH1-52-1]
MSKIDTTPQTSDETDGSERTTDPDAKIHASDLRVGYPGLDEPVVDTETLVVPEGEVTALVGPNGSGKSTLLKALARHLDADTGDVLIDGREIAAYGSKEFARELGMLSQHGSTPEGIMVEELVGHGRYPHKGFLEGQTEEDREAIDRAIDLAGIEHLRETDVSSLSGGQRQLVRIAMALAQETDTLLLDEPTTYLDLRHQLRVMDVIRTLNEERGVTVCIVLHDLTQAARFADYLVALRDGDIYDWGRPEDVVTEGLLAEVFGVEASVEYGTEPRIIPKRALDE